MPVVFDEVIGTVMPETTPAPSNSSSTPAPPKEVDYQQLRAQTQHWQRRCSRLYAD
ncbi:MAG: hypothetical protein AAGG53_08830 [Cyanobacteria bacterium P01_H01_bin.152]